jgi:L-threonylcarbamoyladenylate synthase
MNEAVAALRAGKPVILPTDTVYGLCVTAYRAEPTERMYKLKGRGALEPSALLTAGLDALLECLPELRGRGAVIARAVLPGPYTLVLPNPARRFRWITGGTPEAIGVRVPNLPDAARPIVEAAGALVATSANLAGGRDPRRLADVPAELRERVAAMVDGGELPGTPSTVIDFTGPTPRVLREGAAPSAAAIARAREALAESS